MTAPSSESRKVEAELADMSARILALEDALRSSQLGRSSLDGAVLEVRAADGTRLENWGVQPDGTAGTKSFNKVPPPVPSSADVTPLMAGLDVAWSGQLVGNMPADFRCVDVHVSIQPDFIPGDSTHVGSLVAAGSMQVAPLPYVTHYVKLVAVNRAGAKSEPSLQSSGTPTKVVADGVLDGIIAEVALAQNAVTEAKLAAGAVTTSKVANDAISTPKLIAGAVQASKIAADAVSAGKIAADAVTAREVRALSLTGDEIAANSINAGHVRAGAITADKLAATLVLGNRLVAGSPTGTRVELSASGMVVVRADGEKTFEVDASTGDVTSYGTYYTSRFGERLALNAGGVASPEMRAYPARGSYYASLGALTATARNKADQLAFWIFRVPYLGQNSVVGFVEFVAQNASTRQDIVSSKLWYRPYVNSAGVVIPGLQAFHQDAALTFTDGRVFVRNNDNTADRDFQARRGSFNNIEITGNSMFSRDRNGAIRWESSSTGGDGAVSICDRTGNAGRGIYATNFAPWGSSWRALKTDHTSIADHLGHSALDEVRGLDITAWRYRDPETAGDGDPRTRIGLHLDELHPRLRIRRTDDGGTDCSTWDTVQVLNVALAAVQDVDRENATLRADLAEQRALTARLTARLDALEGAA